MSPHGLTAAPLPRGESLNRPYSGNRVGVPGDFIGVLLGKIAKGPRTARDEGATGLHRKSGSARELGDKPSGLCDLPPRFGPHPITAHSVARAACCQGAAKNFFRVETFQPLTERDTRKNFFAFREFFSGLKRSSR